MAMVSFQNNKNKVNTVKNEKIINGSKLLGKNSNNNFNMRGN